MDAIGLPQAAFVLDSHGMKKLFLGLLSITVGMSIGMFLMIKQWLGGHFGVGPHGHR